MLELLAIFHLDLDMEVPLVTQAADMVVRLMD
jgi:hypothetical protein